MSRTCWLTALFGALAITAADAARTGFRVDTPATAALHEPLRLAARRLQTAPGATAATKNSAIRVALGMVVGPNETQLTFIPAPTFGYAYAPLQISVPVSAASALANLAVLTLSGPNTTSLPPTADSGGAPLAYGQVWQSWTAAYSRGEAADRAARSVWGMLWRLVGIPDRSIRAGRVPSRGLPAPRHAVDALVDALAAAQAALKGMDDLAEQVKAAASVPGSPDKAEVAAVLRANSLAGQSLVVAAELSAAGASSALAAAAALDSEAGMDSRVAVLAAQRAAAHAARSRTIAQRFGSDAAMGGTNATPLPANLTIKAGVVETVALAAAQAGDAAQRVVQTPGSSGLQDLLADARTAAASAASAVQQALAVAQALQTAAAPVDTMVRVQSRSDGNETAATRRIANAVAQATAAATSCGSAALAAMASAALVAQAVLPSPDTSALNTNLSSTPAGLAAGGVLELAQRAVAAANATSVAALGVATVALNPETSPSPSPSPSPSTADSPAFTPLDDALYATVMAAEGLHWAWKLLFGHRSTSIGMDDHGTSGNRARPVAIISVPTYSRPAALVLVREAAELPAFKDGSARNVTSYFDNSTGVVTAEGTVWLNPSTSLSNVSILPGMQPTTRPLDPSTLLGLSGCPLGSDLDRLMLRVAPDVRMPDCSDNSSPLPWRAWLAEHTLVSAASHLPTGTPATSLAVAQKAHAAPQAVITLKSNGTVLARTYNPHIAAYVLAIGRWRVCNSSLQVQVDSSLAPVHRGNTSSKAWTYVGSNTWPLTISQPLQRVPAANNQTAPAALLLGGEPYFLVPGLLVSEDNPGGSTGCAVSGEVGAMPEKQGP